MAGNYYSTSGKNWVVDAIDGTATPGTHYIGWGTGTDAGVGGTALTTESADESRSSATKSQPAADKNQWVATITCATSPKTITEAGVFTASTVGTLVLYSSFTGVALAVGDSIQFTFSLQQT